MAGTARGFGSFPSELLSLIIERLTLTSLVDLRVGVNVHMGQDERVTALRVPLDELDLSRQPSRLLRLGRMTRLVHLELTQSQQQVHNNGAVQLQVNNAMQSAAPTNSGPEIPSLQVELHSRCQLRLLLLAPSMSRCLASLAKLVLFRMSTDSIRTAVRCLAAPSSCCPNLHTLQLENVLISGFYDYRCHERDCVGIAGQDDSADDPIEVWEPIFVALANVGSLRSLELIQGLGNLNGLMHSTLQSLHILDWHNGGCLYSRVPGLTKFVADIRFPRVSELSRLHALDLTGSDLVLREVADNLTSLTHLAIRQRNADVLVDVHSDFGALTRLVSLLMPSHVLWLSDLAPLQSLTILDCAQLNLPDAASSDSLPCLRALLTMYLGLTIGEQPRRKAACRTFPRLEVLQVLHPFQQLYAVPWAEYWAHGGHQTALVAPDDGDSVDWEDEGWPEGGVLQHLRSLSIAVELGSPGLLPVSIAQACVAGDRLRVSFSSQCFSWPSPDPSAALLLSERVRTLELENACVATLCDFAMACPSVTTLTLIDGTSELDVFPPVLADDGLAVLTKMRSLRKLTLRELDHVTATGLASVAAGGDAVVEEVRVVRCQRLTREDARSIMRLAGRPNLDIVVSTRYDAEFLIDLGLSV